MDRPSLTPPACSGCGGLTELIRRSVQVRRGDRLLVFAGWVWSCSRCIDPSVGMPPWRFLDPALQSMQDAHIRDGWLRKFHEPLPEPSEPGRKTMEPRTVRLQLVLTESEARRLDERRGRLSRSAFLRLGLAEEPVLDMRSPAGEPHR